MDASLRLRLRHALHAVDAGLELEPRVDPVSLDLEGGVLDAVDRGVVGVGHVDLPALRLGVADVHAHHLGGEERRFVAAGAGPDLDEDVLVVVGVLRLEEDLDLALEQWLLRLELGNLHFGELAHVVVGAEHLPCVAQALADVLELAVLGDHVLDLGDGLHGLAIGRHVRGHGRIADLRLKLVVALFDFVEFLVHRLWVAGLLGCCAGPLSNRVTQ